MYLIVLTTCDSEDAAARIARRMVEQRLAACASITPGVRSIYHWQGQIEDSTEWSIAFKTRQDLLPRFEAALARVHTYEVPEIVALPLAGVSSSYAAWLDRELAPSA
jgi:periplasmic divalent cation tolerance protein